MHLRELWQIFCLTFFALLKTVLLCTRWQTIMKSVMFREGGILIVKVCVCVSYSVWRRSCCGRTCPTPQAQAEPWLWRHTGLQGTGWGMGPTCTPAEYSSRQDLGFCLTAHLCLIRSEFWTCALQSGWAEPPSHLQPCYLTTLFLLGEIIYAKYVHIFVCLFVIEISTGQTLCPIAFINTS